MYPVTAAREVAEDSVVMKRKGQTEGMEWNRTTPFSPKYGEGADHTLCMLTVQSTLVLSQYYEIKQLHYPPLCGFTPKSFPCVSRLS